MGSTSPIIYNIINTRVDKNFIIYETFLIDDDNIRVDFNIMLSRLTGYTYIISFSDTTKYLKLKS